MKVKVCYTIEVDDYMRRKINEIFGRDGLATREQVQSWFEQNGRGSEDDLMEVVRPDDEEKSDV